MFYPSMVFSEDGVLLEKGGGDTRHLTDAAFGQGLAKDSIKCLYHRSAPCRWWNEANARQEGGGLLRWTVMLLI